MGRAFAVREASILKTGAAKGKLYTTYAKELYLAAKKGSPDPDVNVTLKRLIAKAKKDQVPNDIIKRAIDKAKGVSTEEYHEVIYEGFGPGASTLIIKCLTDNLNRTVSLVRAAFNKINKAIGITNSVAYNYDYLAFVSVKEDEEKIFEALIENNIDVMDLENEDNLISISVHPKDYDKLKDILEKINPDIVYEFDEVGMFAKDEVELNKEDMEKFQILLKLLNDIDDVSKIYHNVKL